MAPLEDAFGALEEFGAPADAEFAFEAVGGEVLDDGVALIEEALAGAVEEPDGEPAEPAIPDVPLMLPPGELDAPLAPAVGVVVPVGAELVGSVVPPIGVLPLPAGGGTGAPKLS